MSARLIVVGGPGGVGSSTYAAKLAESLCASQTSDVLLAALDDRFGATAISTAEAVGRLAPFGAAADPDGGLTSVVDFLGLNPRMLTESTFLPSAAMVRTLWKLGELAETADVVVVLDAGPHIAEFALAAHQFTWLVHEALPAQRGWLSSTRPLVAAGVGKRWPGTAAYQQVQRAWAIFSAARELIGESEAHLVDRQDGRDTSPAKVRHLARGLRLAGVPTIVGAQPGTSHAGGIEIVEAAGGFDWRMPLPGFEITQLHLEHVGDDLVLSGYGYRRVITLSSVFQRLAPTGANLVEGMLTIRFRLRKETTS